MFRLIRTSTLQALHANQAELERALEELAQAKAEVAIVTDSAVRAEVVADDLLKQTAQAHADRIQAERDRDTANAALARAKAGTEKQMAELRDDLAKIRAAAADTETGETVRAALAYHVLRDMYADAWKQGLLPNRPYDLMAVLLDFDTADQNPATPAPAA